MLEAELNAKNILTSYFNAWERDYEREPFILILQKMIVTLKGDEALKNEIKETALKVLKSLAVNGSKAVVSFLIPQGTTKALEDFATEVTSSTTENIFDSLDKEQEEIEKLSNLLKKLIEKNQDKYVFIIDELDRCRPDFSIALLERLKHIFNTPNLVFVIATDLKQLGNAVSGIYGEKFDGRKYLDKFIDFEYNLIEPSFEKLWQSLVLEIKGKPSIEQLDIQSTVHKYALWLIKNLQLNARDIKRIFNRLYAALLSSSSTDNTLLITLLTFIQYVDKDYFNTINRNIIEPTYLCKLFRLDYHLSKRTKFKDDLDNEFIAILVYLSAFLMDRCNHSEILKDFNMRKRLGIEEFIIDLMGVAGNDEHIPQQIYFQLYEKNNPFAQLRFDSEQFDNALKIVNMQREISFKHYSLISHSVTVNRGNTK